jgi:hypothetical protein
VADLGTIIKEDVVSHDFVVHNSGREPVRIERVAPSCPCTTVDFDQVVPPGGEGTLRVTLDTATVIGRGSASIEVYAEGYAAPAVKLILEYKVEPRLLADPGQARWNFVQHEKEGTIVQTVYSADGAEFEIVEVESPMPAIRVEHREPEPGELIEKVEGDQWAVEATLASDAPVGPITGYLVVHTTHPRQKVLRIPVSGFVRPAVFVEPARARFGRVDADDLRPAVFRVRTFATDPIALVEAETDLPGVSVRIVPVAEGRDYRVVLEFDPASMEAGPFAGTLRLRTDSETTPTVTAGFSGTWVAGAGEGGD